MLHAKRFSDAQVRDPAGWCGAGHAVLSHGGALTVAVFIAFQWDSHNKQGRERPLL